MDKVAIIGSSGFGREVRDVCVALGARELRFLEKAPFEAEVDGIQVIEDTIEAVAELVSDGWRLAIGIGTPSLRKSIYENYSEFPFVTLIHPSTTFGVGQRELVERSQGSIVTAGVRMTNNIRFGNQVVVNLNSTIGHDSIMGNYCAIMPGVNVSGNVELKDSVYLGTGAAIVNGENDRLLTIGAGATVGAGAVVVRDVPPGETVVGVPARTLQK